jgi:hypothetical protein
MKPTLLFCIWGLGYVLALSGCTSSRSYRVLAVEAETVRDAPITSVTLNSGRQVAFDIRGGYLGSVDVGAEQQRAVLGRDISGKNQEIVLDSVLEIRFEKKEPNVAGQVLSVLGIIALGLLILFIYAVSQIRIH